MSLLVSCSSPNDKFIGGWFIESASYNGLPVLDSLSLNLIIFNEDSTCIAPLWKNYTETHTDSFYVNGNLLSIKSPNPVFDQEFKFSFINRNRLELKNAQSIVYCNKWNLNPH